MTHSLSLSLSLSDLNLGNYDFCPCIRRGLSQYLRGNKQCQLVEGMHHLQYIGGNRLLKTATKIFNSNNNNNNNNSDE